MIIDTLTGLKSKKIGISELKLDPKNARFGHIKKLKSDEKIEQHIWNELDTRTLYSRILAAKGLYEDLVIDSNNVVMEGNRRLVCLRNLQKAAQKGELKGISKTFFDEISCKAIPIGATRKQIDIFLASIHVKGKKNWNAFSKAKLIYELSTKHKISDKDIQEHLSIGPGILKRAIQAYEATKDYGEKYSDEGWYNKFTFYDELFKKKDLADFRKEKRNILKFGKWIQEKNLTEVRDVRVLPNVLANKWALKRFEEKDMKEAIKFLEPRNPAMVSTEFKRIQGTIKFVKDFPYSELKKTIDDKERWDLINELKESIDSLITRLNSLKKTMKAMPTGM